MIIWPVLFSLTGSLARHQRIFEYCWIRVSLGALSDDDDGDDTAVYKKV